MTETEWLTCDDPDPMLACLEGTATDRKVQLFAVACCRRIWHLIGHEAYRHFVDLAESHADGHIGWADLLDAEQAVYKIAGTQGRDSALWAASHTKCDTGSMCPIYLPDDTAHFNAALAVSAAVGRPDERSPAECLAQTELLRDIFGNPFRPAIIDSAVISSSSAVHALVQTIYNEWAFARMYELADALERAGCTNADILKHCRGPGPHVRGCWVLDLILGKE